MADIKPTEEQIHAIKTAHSGDTFVVDAVAGSGKTTTARKMCEAISGNILYLVYNRAAADDARASFPRRIKVSTTAALAWHEYKDDYGDRMRNSRVPARETARLAGITKPVPLGGNLTLRPVTVARLAVDTIQRFCYSADLTISEKHCPVMPLGLEPLQIEVLKSEVAKVARKIWQDSLKPSSQHRFTYDHAFKLLVMSEPNLGFDTVIIDEAQDSNAATMALLNQQHDSQLIAVGDPAQQLYQWRGSQDIMGEFVGPRLSLSKSFRFGESIAEEADKWLAHSGTHIRVTGNEHMDSKVTCGTLTDPKGVLCRTNGTVMAKAMDYLERGLRVAVAGGTSSLEQLAYAANDLRSGKPTTHPELAAFQDWADLMSYTEEPGGGDLKALVQLINSHGVPGILSACKQLEPETKPSYGAARDTWKEPDVVISTAHKAKGREWSSVYIAEDFKEPKDVEDPRTGEMEPGPIDHHSAMLHYVAVTRARHHLDRDGLAWIDRHPAVDKLNKAG